MNGADLLQQFTHGSGMNVALGGCLDDFFAMAVQRPQHTVALASCLRFHKDARAAPDHPKEGPEHQVRSIDQEDFAPAFGGRAQPWLHLGLQELELQLGIGFAGNLAALAQCQPQPFHDPPGLAL